MSNINLSVVVPTYNRAELLNFLLESIVSDFKQWPNDLELIVIDNSSTDETATVVSKFINQNLPIKYFVNEKNIGMDGNLAACFDVASGKFFWQIGDDEIMYHGTVKYVLELCRTKEFGILHLSNKWFSHGQQVEVSLLSKPNIVEVEILDSKKIFRLANIFLTFISANVVNRQAVLKHFPNFDSKAEINTNLPQLAWTYSALLTTDVHYYVATPLFGALGGNTRGYKLIEVFGVNLINITKKYLYSSHSRAHFIMKHAVITRLLAGEIMSFLNEAANRNQFESEDFREATESAFGNDFFYRVFIKPILSRSSLTRSFSWLLVRVFNRLNRTLNYRLL